MPVTLTAVESTDLFTGPEHAPRQLLRVTLDGPPATRITVTGPGVRGEAAGTGQVEVPLKITGAAPGARLPVTVEAGGARAGGVVEVAEPGWTMFLVSHFHYDPVWWNTQAAYTSPGSCSPPTPPPGRCGSATASRWSTPTSTSRCATRCTSSCSPKSTI